eukprot:4263730-Prymnesium_polylepis.1
MWRLADASLGRVSRDRGRAWGLSLCARREWSPAPRMQLRGALSVNARLRFFVLVEQFYASPPAHLRPRENATFQFGLLHDAASAGSI